MKAASALVVLLLTVHSCDGAGGWVRGTKCKGPASGLETCLPPSQEFIYTPLADPLLALVESNKAQSSPATSASLNINLVLGSDYYDAAAGILTADYGFQGYMGVPGLIGTGPESRAAAYANNVSWELLPAILDAETRAYYSALGVQNLNAVYGFTPSRPADTLPVVFNQPVLPSSISPNVFRVTLNNGSTVTPLAASLLPNLEYNERQTVVLIGLWGNRLTPGTPGAYFPVHVEIVDDPTNPLIMIGPNGFTNATGLGVVSKNPYEEGNGSRMITAKLNAFSQLGEGAPAWCGTSTANSGADLYGDLPGLYRLRIYDNFGFSPDGIASISPDDFSTYFYLTAIDKRGKSVKLTKTGKRYKIRGYGTITILGLADTGLKQSVYGPAYIEDHDNQYDVILQGSLAAVQQIQSVTLPSTQTVADRSPPTTPPHRHDNAKAQARPRSRSSNKKWAYRAVYNPGGPGNNPSSNPPGVPFVVPSTYHAVPVENDIVAASYVTYVEVNGTVARGPNGQPVGRLLGPAVISRRTGYTISAYMDAQSHLFYASFPVQSG